MRTTPLYVRLAEAIRREIAEGRAGVGERLPTEAELSRLHAVSRITVRQALDVLRQEGLIERFAGRGSFVTRGSGTPSWVIDSIRDIVRLTAQTETHIIDWKPVIAPAPVARFFRLSGETVYRLRGIRTRHHVKTHYVELYVPHEIGRQITKEDLIRRTVVDLIESKLGIPVAAAREEIWATTADSMLARYLRVRAGAAVLVQDLQFLGFERRPLEWLRVSWHAGEFRRRIEMSLKPGR